MSFIKRMLADLRVMKPIYPLCGGIGLAILGLITLMSCGCHPMYHWLLLPRSALPYWIFALLGFLMFFLFGVAIGLLFSLPYCKNNVYSTVILMLMSVVMMMVWYHVLFRSLNTLISILMLLTAIGIELFAILGIAPYNALSAVTLIPVLLIQSHFLWLNIGIRFLN